MTRIYISSSSSLLSLSCILKKLIAGSSPRVLSPGGGFMLGLDVEAFIGFRLTVLALLYFNTSQFSNQASGSNFTMPQLRKLW